MLISLCCWLVWSENFGDKKEYSILSFDRLKEKVPNLSQDEFYNQEEEILFLLEIPKIGLKREIYFINSAFNHVDYQVEILADSSLEREVLFLASHSGRGDHAYFNDLFLLEKGDFIWIIYQGKRVSFVVDRLYYIAKNGYFKMEEKVSRTLYLITCSRDNSREQFVVEAKLIY